MKALIYILLFLLIVSVANNYVLHKYQLKQNTNNCKLTLPNNLPSNLGIVRFYVFYNKDQKYNKCFINDNKKMANAPYFMVKLNNVVDDIYKATDDKCYIVTKKDLDEVNLNNYLDKAIKKLG